MQEHKGENAVLVDLGVFEGHAQAGLVDVVGDSVRVNSKLDHVVLHDEVVSVGDVLLGDGVQLALFELAEPDVFGVSPFEADPEVLVFGLQDSETENVGLIWE